MSVVAKVVLVPDLYGRLQCKECGGRGWNFGYDEEGNSIWVDCPACNGNGHFVEETIFVDLVTGEITKDSPLPKPVSVDVPIVTVRNPTLGDLFPIVFQALKS